MTLATTGVSPRFAGINFHRCTPLRAALSSREKPLERWIDTASGRPCVETFTFNNTVPVSLRRLEVRGYLGGGLFKYAALNRGLVMTAPVLARRAEPWVAAARAGFAATAEEAEVAGTEGSGGVCAVCTVGLALGLGLAFGLGLGFFALGLGLAFTTLGLGGGGGSTTGGGATSAGREGGAGGVMSGPGAVMTTGAATMRTCRILGWETGLGRGSWLTKSHATNPCRPNTVNAPKIACIIRENTFILLDFITWCVSSAMMPQRHGKCSCAPSASGAGIEVMLCVAIAKSHQPPTRSVPAK